MVKLEYSVAWGVGTTRIVHETDPDIRMQEYAEAQKSVLEEIARDKAARKQKTEKETS